MTSRFISRVMVHYFCRVVTQDEKNICCFLWVTMHLTITMHDKLCSFFLLNIYSFITNIIIIIGFEMNLSGHCVTNRYLTFIILNEHPCTQLLGLRRLRHILLLIYLLVYRIGLSNDVMHVAVLP